MNKNLNRRDFLKKAGISAAAITFSGCMSRGFHTGKALQDMPNITIFISDDHGYEFSGCYGNEIVKTPNIDRLSQEGLRFTHVFAGSPSCTPSRSIIYTGLMPFRNGAHPNHSHIKPGVKTLGYYLKGLGYRVVLASKTHVNPFEQFEFEYLKATLPVNPNIKRIYRQEGLDTAQIESFLGEHIKTRGRQPLCLIICSPAPHVIWRPNAGYEPGKIALAPYLVDTQKTREAMCRYYSDIADMDRELGRCLEAVAKHGLENNTLFIYTTDEGPEWPHAKWTLYDGGLQVPFIARWPGQIKAGCVTDAMISLVDIMPTFIDVAGGKVPEDIDGKSFLGVLLGKKKEHRKEIFATHTRDGKMNDFPMRCIRTSNYKYILNLRPESKYTTHFSEVYDSDHGEIWESWVKKAETDKSAAEIVDKFYHHPAEELYDLRTDPYEMKNIALEPENRKPLENLRSKVKQWMQQQGDDGTSQYM